MSVKKYIIGLALTFAAGVSTGYFLKGAEDNMPMQKQARFEANAIQSTSEDYKKITGELYDAQQTASSLDKKLANLRKTIEGMDSNFRGSPGRPGGSGVGDLFPGRRKVVDEPGSATAKGLEDLFKGPGQKKKSDSGNDNEKKSDEDTQRPLKDSHERFDRTYKKIQEDLKSAHEYVRQIHENAEAGRKALEDGRRALQGSSGGSLNLPDVPIIPNFPNTPKIDKDKKEEKK